MSDVGDWFRSLPVITRHWFGATVGFCLLGRFGLLPPVYLILQYIPLVHQFQIWRLVTCVFFYPLTPQTGFHFLINLYFLYNYSLRLEQGIFTGRPGDYLFMLLFCWICGIIVALMANIMLLMDIMVLCVLYVWCQLNKDQIVTFWFGTQFKAMYLPWVLLGFNMIIVGGGIMELVGILIGHLYFFLKFKYPQDFGGPQLLQTPQIMYKLLPNVSGGRGGFGVPPPAARRAPPAGGGGGGGGHQWGAGNVLGDNH